jgi:hypothetical protein
MPLAHTGHSVRDRLVCRSSHWPDMLDRESDLFWSAGLNVAMAILLAVLANKRTGKLEGYARLASDGH